MTATPPVLGRPAAQPVISDGLPSQLPDIDPAETREWLGSLRGFVPERRVVAKPLVLPEEKVYAQLRKGSGNQPVATTMAFVRLLKELMRDPEVGHRFVPVVPDEGRTFGMDPLFSSVKIYSPNGQTYESADRAQLLSWKEASAGQILPEGINEAGSMAPATGAVKPEVVVDAVRRYRLDDPSYFPTGVSAGGDA